MADLGVYDLSLQYFSYIRKLVDDNKRLCAMEPRLQLKKKALPLAGRKRAAARSAGQDLTLLSYRSS